MQILLALSPALFAAGIGALMTPKCFCYIGLPRLAEIPCENPAVYSFEIPGKGTKTICAAHVAQLHRAANLLSIEVLLTRLPRPGEPSL